MASLDVLRIVLRTVREDLSQGVRHVLINSVAGGALTPRRLRVAIYRAVGMAVETPDVFSGNTFVGTATFAVGKRSFVNNANYFECRAPITIGQDTSIGMSSMFVTSDHPIDADGRYSLDACGLPIRIGDRCWIGARVTVVPGVTIGDDVVVGAGSVVTRDCAPGGLYAGVPARRVRDLQPGGGRGRTESELAR
jgi:acetyltransferase-like isoleucine patch superfamily enzyme